MKICKFQFNEKFYWGVVEEEKVFPLDVPLDALPDAKFKSKDFFLIDKVKLLLPFSPSKIVCVGRNYSDHAKELGNEVPSEPLLFLKAPSSLILNGEEIKIPSQSKQVEHEGELAFIIGRSCKNLSANDNFEEFVFGYFCLNDVTARDLQKKDVQFTRAKSFDTFCPVSELIETDFDPTDVLVQTKVNGETKQIGRTSQMIFDVEFLVKYVSNQMTLNAGDIISTGTPAGVSKMSPGDVCEIEIEGLPILRNKVL